MRVEEDFKVVLGKEQIGLLRVSRRWHVVSLTCAFVGLVAGIPAIHTVWGRMRCVSITIIVIVSIGEVKIGSRLTQCTRTRHTACDVDSSHCGACVHCVAACEQVIEFAKRMHKRTARSNAERLIFLVVKVARSPSFLHMVLHNLPRMQHMCHS